MGCARILSTITCEFLQDASKVAVQIIPLFELQEAIFKVLAYKYLGFNLISPVANINP